MKNHNRKTISYNPRTLVIPGVRTADPENPSSREGDTFHLTGMDRGGMISLESLPNRTDIKVNISGKEVEEIMIHIKAILRVTEFKNLDIDPRQAPSETKEGLTSAVNQEIEKMVDASLKKTKLLQADVFELGERVRMVSPSLWKQHSDEWNEDIFPGIPIRVKVHTTIRDIGETYQTITKK